MYKMEHFECDVGLYGYILMLREAQLDQVLVTGSKASQFLRPFCPQGSDPPTT